MRVCACVCVCVRMCVCERERERAMSSTVILLISDTLGTDLMQYAYEFLELIHHVTQEEKNWELCTALFLAYYPSSAEHNLDFSLLHHRI